MRTLKILALLVLAFLLYYSFVKTISNEDGITISKRKFTAKENELIDLFTIDSNTMVIDFNSKHSIKRIEFHTTLYINGVLENEEQVVSITIGDQREGVFVINQVLNNEILITVKNKDSGYAVKILPENTEVQLDGFYSHLLNGDSTIDYDSKNTLVTFYGIPKENGNSDFSKIKVNRFLNEFENVLILSVRFVKEE